MPLYLSLFSTMSSFVYLYSLYVHMFKLYLSVFILRGCWMLESDWLTNVLRCAIIFRETHGERSSRHRITCPYHFAKWFVLFQRSLAQPKTAKEPKPTRTLAKQINIVNKRIKMTDHIHVFATKLHFIMFGKHILSLSRSLSLTDSLHTLT